jgi:tricorn protease
MRLMRFPTIHGDTIVFSYASDLWSTDLNGGFARRLTSGPGTEIRPRISPDGKQIAFTANYDGNVDVYTIPIDGGEPKRLTFEPEPDNVIGWTPSGKIMVVSPKGFSGRQGSLYLVDPEGGYPKATVVKEISEGSISADGTSIAYNRVPSQNFNWRRYRGGTQGRVSIMNLNSLAYKELPSNREQSYYPMYVGDAIYYISDRNQGTLNLYKNVNGKDTQITKFADADIRFPSTDGKKMVWERDGYLWVHDLASGAEKKVNPLVRGDFVARRAQFRKLGGQISSLGLSPSGVRVAVEARGELFSVPAKNGETRNLTSTSKARERFPAWSPDGKSIAYVSDASGETEVYIKPQMGGDAEKLTEAKKAIVSLTWSPDSKSLLLTTNDVELWILDVSTKKLTKVVKGTLGLGGGEWSPDSKWIVYTSNDDERGFGAINLYEVATGKATKVSSGQYADGAASFDLNGKYLYFTSERTFAPSFGIYEFSLKVEDASRIYAIPLTKDLTNPLIAAGDEEMGGGGPAPTLRPGGPGAPGAPGGPGGPGGPPPGPPAIKIDLDGMAERAFVLPLPAGNYPIILGSMNGVLYWNAADGTLSRFDLGSREPMPIAQIRPSSLDVNPSRTKIAYVQAGQVYVNDIRPSLAPGQGRVDTNAVEGMVDYKDEWTQMFWETWRFVRDNFYDPGMAGQNWRAIGDRYAKYLPYVAHRADLNYVLGLMVGELGTGHSYVQGGEIQGMPLSVPTGQLGADYEIVGNNVKFSKIYAGANYDESRRGPLGEPGVNVKAGDFLLEVDGIKVDGNTNPNQLMMGKVGRTVLLTVNDKPSLEGARKVRVRPIANEGELRYWDFVESNRKYVLEKSGGRIGYMHIPDTQFNGAVEFIRGFYSQWNKDALIVDERWNGGGYIQPWFVDTLARTQKAKIQARHALADQKESPSNQGPMAMLINQYAGSGGDFFPFMFRQAKRGPLIGKRTWGGLVGISAGAPLVDGGSVTAPSFAIFDPETNEIIAENRGTPPDIDVDARPDLWAKGIDPQLDAAIDHLMGELKKLPPAKVRKDIPKVGKEGRVGG